MTYVRPSDAVADIPCGGVPGGRWLRAVRAAARTNRTRTSSMPTQQYLGRLPDADDHALAAFETVRHRRS
jgi:hypothetical protein